MTEFFAMNGYGFYVWGAYGVTALAVVVELLALRGRRRRAYAEAQTAGEALPAGRTAEVMS